MGCQPEELSYTAEHEWLYTLEDSTCRFGITDFAQGALGDVVYVDLPEVGRHFSQGDVMGEIESTKSVSEIYAPVEGVIVASNEKLKASPEIINSDPYGSGWIALIKPTDSQSLSSLLSYQEYQKITDQNK